MALWEVTDESEMIVAFVKLDEVLLNGVRESKPLESWTKVASRLLFLTVSVLWGRDSVLMFVQGNALCFLPTSVSSTQLAEAGVATIVSDGSQSHRAVLDIWSTPDLGLV
jgi:hypothetical protein